MTARLSGSKIFITGGAGFIGSWIAHALGHDNEVVLFDDLHRNGWQGAELDELPHVRLVQGDVLDLDALRRAMPPDVEYVVHAAAIAGVETVIANPLRGLEVNVKGTFNVAEAALGLPRLKRFVDLSTSEVFGRHAWQAREDTLAPTITVGEPRWAYMVSKLVGEFVVHAHHEQHRMPTVTIRPFNVYGPGQVGVGAIHRFVRQALAGQDLVVHDDGTQVRAWCYVDDFVDGLLRAMSSERSVGRTYNIGNPRSTVTVYALARLVIALANSPSRIVFKTTGRADVAVRVPDIGAARADLGFEPVVELEEGLSRTIAWYRAAV